MVQIESNTRSFSETKTMTQNPSQRIRFGQKIKVIFFFSLTPNYNPTKWLKHSHRRLQKHVLCSLQWTGRRNSCMENFSSAQTSEYLGIRDILARSDREQWCVHTNTSTRYVCKTFMHTIHEFACLCQLILFRDTWYYATFYIHHLRNCKKLNN